MRGTDSLEKTVMLGKTEGKKWYNQDLNNRLILWCWMICLGNKQIILSFFEIAPNYCILDSFVDYEGYSISQPWIFIGRTDAETEAPILWPPDTKSQLIQKDPDAGKDWRQGEKGTTEDEMVGWHHWLDGHEFEQILGDSEEQGSLACCSPWGRKELDTT